MFHVMNNDHKKNKNNKNNNNEKNDNKILIDYFNLMYIDCVNFSKNIVNRKDDNQCDFINLYYFSFKAFSNYFHHFFIINHNFHQMNNNHFHHLLLIYLQFKL